jgi:ABC-2 type transport system permease protein
MSFAVGSTLWLMAHELRLTWRGALKRGRRRMLIVGGALLALMSLAGVAVGVALRRMDVPMVPGAIMTADAMLAIMFTVMLSQTLAAATEALYSRGDLDLLLSSPVAPHRVVAVRLAAIATNVFSIFAILISPFLLPIALIGHPAWLAAYLVLAALALSASATGLILAMGLFRLIGPRRTRAVAQILAALMGAAFFLASQARIILGSRQLDLWLGALNLVHHNDLGPPPIAAWPLEALLGHPAPLGLLLAASGLLFVATALWLGRRFAANAAAAGGVTTAKASATRASSSFIPGAFAATVRKELRLLTRDIALLSQVLLRLLYLAPLTFVLLRNAGAHADRALPTGVAVLCFVTGQVAENLSWITMSAEDAPELIACAPVPIAALWQAKLTAALVPLALLMAVPLGFLAVLSPVAGLVAVLGAAASAMASGLINTWHQKPGKRSEFRRRSAAAWTINLAQLLVGGLIAAAAGLAAGRSLYALAPLAAAALVLVVLRRNDEQIIEALAAG